MKKLFAGIHSVGFGEGNQSIISMKSLEGEVVPLDSPIQISPNVEVKDFILKYICYRSYYFSFRTGLVGST